ncbi:MAG: hypothetical protein PHC34_11140 [Candidatus Gastranaerophilales bacterium]|nr:hypothetical protein [Candidatus Gastranaerophilales bacterium]
MYILELIAKAIKNKRKKNKFSEENENEYETCDHLYFAIDSTADYMACSKCGDVIKNFKKNIFKT